MKARVSAMIVVAALIAPAPATANDFPTQARVEYVLRCMDASGGQNYNTLYACVCTIDRIAEAFTYAEFEEAEAFALLRSTQGERGGVFRDPERARELQQRYQETVAAAEQACNVVARPPDGPGKS